MNGTIQRSRSTAELPSIEVLPVVDPRQTTERVRLCCDVICERSLLFCSRIKPFSTIFSHAFVELEPTWADPANATTQ